MPQIFHPATNTLMRMLLPLGVLLFGGSVWAFSTFVRSPYLTQAGVIRDQPIPFSHKHHVGGLGLDCRYCHSAVEQAPSAGMPSVGLCMGCHAHIWSDSPMLEPLRTIQRTGQPLGWTRVHDLADFVYFDHSIHVHKGVACVTCHGAVDDMPLMWRQASLHMDWCLECHRNPQRYVVPRDQVFSTNPRRSNDRQATRLLEDYAIERGGITNCSRCHR